MDIAFLGDSLTEGRPGAAYLPLLAQRLPQHRLLNHGRAGDTVADLLLRMRRRGLGPVDLAVIWIGANDAVLGEWRDSGADEAVRRDYTELADWTAQRARRLLLVQPIILEAEGSAWAARAAELGALVRHLGAARGAEVLDLGPAFAAARAAGRGPFTIDGVHFTPAGAEVVADAVAAAIQALPA